jgi:hypothetical protein
MSKRQCTEEDQKDPELLDVPVLVHDYSACEDGAEPQLMICHTKKEKAFVETFSKYSLEENTNTALFYAKNQRYFNLEEIRERTSTNHHEHLSSYYSAFIGDKSTVQEDGSVQTVFTNENRHFTPWDHDQYYDICDTCRALVPTTEQDGKTVFYFPTLDYTKPHDQVGKTRVNYFIYVHM